MADPIRVLVLDHFSGQDRSALVAAGGDDFSWRVIPYWRLRNGANRFFPVDVQHGLAPYARPDLAPNRAAFADWLGREVRRLYREWPFDVFLLPSDAFYYVRPLPDVLHELGLPVAVAQKETTITDYFFTAHAPDVQAHAPFISDVMTVCSERQKRFWVTAGARADDIVVTGQPRFDVYAEKSQARQPSARSRPTILFLSFEPDAYLLELEDRAVGWLDLRSEIEEELASAAERGARVVVKFHPLQDEQKETESLRSRFGDALEIASSVADTRLLIRGADAVVGFQTTALYEALIADKPTGYTAWGTLYDRFTPNLIPFDERADILDVLRSPEELRRWLADPPAPTPETTTARRAFVEEVLGPIDGRASERMLAVLRTLHLAWSGRPTGARSRRHRLERAARPAAAAVVAVSGAKLAGLSASLRLSGVLPDRARSRVRAAAAFRLERERERLATALRTLREGSGRS